MKWTQSKTDPSRAHYRDSACGTWRLVKSLVRGDPVYLLVRMPGREIVASGSREACEEAAREEAA